jgi:hypothetical protein
MEGQEQGEAMNRSEWRKNRRRILRERNAYDDTGMYFWYYEMLMWERDHNIALVKSCAKEVMKEMFGDEHMQTLEFMTRLGKRVKTRLRTDADYIWAEKMGPPPCP